MQSDRHDTFIARLAIALQDETLKKQYREKSKASLAKSDATRVFDTFQCLLAKNDLEKLTHQFREILLSTHRVRQTKRGPILTEITQKEAIKRWLKTIAGMGCQELFDARNNLKPELIQLLGWEKFVDKIDNCELVCAFVNEINLTVFEGLSDIIRTHQDQYNALCQTINQAYRQWTAEVLDVFGIPYHHDRGLKLALQDPSSDSESDVEDDNHLNKGLATGLGIAAGVLVGGAAIAGFLLFGKIPTPSPTSSPDITPPNSPRF